ncbi:MAG: MBL fold metallo-hydrolase [Planctomycetes bacterium]|nr:MBL fold metallo-hydrolase [Planctomycetota bacterium]
MADQEIEIVTFADELFGQNSRLIISQGDRFCWVIDPGFAPATDGLLKHIIESELAPKAVILTHAHADHIAGLSQVLNAHEMVPVYLAKIEWSFLDDPSQNLSTMTGMELRVSPPELRDLAPDQVLELGGTQWQVLDTSGHSPGGRTLYCPAAQTAIVGDALFAGSIGRVDFPHSNGPRLLTNIREKLFTLPDSTRVCSGHGPDTTIEIERTTNPFFSNAEPF